MINTNNINEAIKQIQKLKKEGKKIFVQARGDEFNRKIFENKDIIVLGLEFNKSDFLKQRNSGLNEVLCKLARDNNIKIGIDIDKISKLDKIEKARVLSRIRQNIQLCKRIGCKMIVFSENNKNNISKQEIMSFFLSFGGSTKQGKDAEVFNKV